MADDGFASASPILDALAMTVGLWERRGAADFRGIEADERAVRSLSPNAAAMALGAFPALLLPLPVAAQTAIATAALQQYGTARRPFDLPLARRYE